MVVVQNTPLLVPLSFPGHAKRPQKGLEHDALLAHRCFNTMQACQILSQ